MPVKLSKRLTSLLQHCAPDYDAFWDCCCDHGLLGMGLLEQYPQKTVHFVDQVSAITAKLAGTLAQLNAQHYQVHTLNAGFIDLPPAQHPLIILAGIGGETAIELINSIESRHPSGQRHYLISPNYQLYDLRTFLRQRGFSLIRESLVTENGRHNEILLISNSGGHKTISPCGEFWQKDSVQQRDYCQRLIRHYAQKQQPDIAAQYTAVVKKYGLLV